MTAPGPVVFQVKINGETVNESPLDFELRQSWGNHDLFFIRLAVVSNKPYKHMLAAWPDGSPVEIVWGRKPHSVSTWYGYINHHESSSTDDQNLGVWQMTYVAIGSSKVLNGHKNRTWKNTTAAGIAQSIARENGLRAITTAQPGWILNEVQANESNFQFMNRIADKVGLRFWVSGGSLYLIDPLVLLSGASDYIVPQYRVDQMANHQDTANNFKIVQGDNIPGALQMNRKAYGVDSRGVYSVTADGDTFANDTIDITRHVASRGDARNLQNARKAISQFWIQATVDVFGYTVLYPGKVISLQGYAIPDGDSGDWIVTGADHVLSPSGTRRVVDDQYVTRLTIIRNTKSASLVPNIKSVRKVTPEIISCRLQNKQWFATNMNAITEGVE